MMFHNGRAWVEDTDDYGFTPRAKEIAAAGKFPDWEMVTDADCHLYLHPIGLIKIRQTDVIYLVYLEFYGADIELSPTFFTLQAAKMAGLNKIEGLLYDTHRNISAGINFATDEEDEQAGFRGEVKDWIAIVGKDFKTLDTNGGQLVERQPFDSPQQETGHE